MLQFLIIGSEGVVLGDEIAVSGLQFSGSTSVHFGFVQRIDDDLVELMANTAERICNLNPLVIVELY